MIEGEDRCAAVLVGLAERARGGRRSPRASQLLIARRTRANDSLASHFARQLAVAYPAHPEDAIAALRGETPWPGSALVWVKVENDRVRSLATR